MKSKRYAILNKHYATSERRVCRVTRVAGVDIYSRDCQAITPGKSPAYQSKVNLRLSRPGKPSDNAFIESFNGKLRNEYLNTHWFSSIEDAKLKLVAWRINY